MKKKLKNKVLLAIVLKTLAEASQLRPSLGLKGFNKSHHKKGRKC